MTSDARAQLDSGFGLVEVVVSMFLLALLAVTFAPTFIGAMKTSSANTTVATGNQLLAQQLDRLRAIPPYCDDVTAYGGAALDAVTDHRGVTYQPARKVGACPADYPGVVRVTVTISPVGPAVQVLRASTFFYVQAQSEESS